MAHHSVYMERIAEFLVEAKRRTYAAGGGASSAVVSSLLPGGHQLEFGAGELLYRDIYFGEARFVGQELVYSNGEPIWSMCYAGGFVVVPIDAAEAGEIGGVLQAALRLVARERPFRGPRSYVERGLVYEDSSSGGIEWFAGFERIRRATQEHASAGAAARGAGAAAIDAPVAGAVSGAVTAAGRIRVGAAPDVADPRELYRLRYSGGMLR